MSQIRTCIVLVKRPALSGLICITLLGFIAIGVSYIHPVGRPEPLTSVSDDWGILLVSGKLIIWSYTTIDTISDDLRADIPGFLGWDYSTFSSDKALYAAEVFVIFLWFPLAIPFLILLGVFARYVMLSKRCPHGFCNKCGYDLRHNTSGICPECRTSVRNCATNQP